MSGTMGELCYFAKIWKNVEGKFIANHVFLNLNGIFYKGLDVMELQSLHSQQKKVMAMLPC
jgi:hypothetical protein